MSETNPILDRARPDQDLVDELVHVLNKHTDRLSVGSAFGSLLVVMNLLIHNRNVSRPASPQALRGLVALAVTYLMKPTKPANPGNVIQMKN